MLYLNLCELCQKKSFMIKPITSTDNINLHYQDLVDIHTQTNANNYKTHWRAIRESYKNNLNTRKSSTSSAAKNKSKYNKSLSSIIDIRHDKRKKSNFSVGEKFSSSDMVSLIYSDIQIKSFNQTDSTECDEMYPEQILQNTGSALNVPPETKYQPKLGFKKLSGMQEGKDELREEQEELAIMEEMKEAKYSKNNPIQLFFQRMASTVMTFPPELAIETRKRVNDIVSEMELFANALRTKAMNKPIEPIDMPPIF
ncbi:Hypothetical protein CINCED_3A010323 [Cinara cedri]|uniref:MADF domain-containing protein n=1 Tax=Cinara cedri TaxID=506608 RepID=A0A5E4MZF0_9HEMI|nr:Hypothetical protein CINCED_3A010323 [Cinara cedri]